MKYLIIISLLSLGSCWAYVPCSDSFEDYQAVVDYVKENYSYQADVVQDFRTPSQTYRDRCGDCEDLNGLLLTLLHDSFQVEPELHLILLPVATGPNTKKPELIGHAVVYLDGYYYDATGALPTIEYKEDMFEVIQIISYRDYMQHVWYQ